MRRIQVSDSFVLLLAAALLLDTTQITLQFFAAAGLHELGHLFAIWSCGARIKTIQLNLFGGVICYQQTISRLAEVWIAAAGPLAGLLAAYAVASAGYFSFAGANLVLSLVNLLPVLPLDGGRIVQQIAPVWVQYVCAWVSRLLVTGVGIWFTITGYGYSLLLFSFVLWKTYLQNIKKLDKIKKIV